MTPRLKELYIKEIQPSLKEKFGFKNIYMTPSIQKVVINMGLGLDGNDSKIIKSCEQDLANIGGQKPVLTKFKNLYQTSKQEKAQMWFKSALRKNKCMNLLIDWWI